MKSKTSIQEILEDKLTQQIIKILLTTFKLEENFIQLSNSLKTSRPTLKKKIDLLAEHEIIIRDKTKIHLTTDIEIFKILDESVPVDKTSKNNKIETLQRELVYQYIIKYKDEENFFKLRPADNFDIREAIQPSISISNKLEITEASESFYKLFNEVENGENKRHILNFFKGINMYLYDLDNDVISTELAFTTIYNKLLTNGYVKLNTCYIKESGEKVFLSIFVIMQTNFIGMQSVMHNITETVKTQRVRSRLTHRFYHLVSIVDGISDKLRDLNIKDKKFISLTSQLDRVSSFDYLESVYAANTKPIVEMYRDFKLNKNLESIVEQLNFIYQIPKDKLIYNKSEYSIKISNCYDIYFYEGFYLLIENLILKSTKDYSCSIRSYKKNNIIYIEIFFNQAINSLLEAFVKSLKVAILKNSQMNQNHLDLQIFIDELSREGILELVISTYFEKITLEDNNKAILFELKDTSAHREINIPT